MSTVLPSVSYNLFDLDDASLGNLLSDHSSPGLNQVVSTALTPLQFAEQVVKGPIRNSFIERFLTITITRELANAWLFDYALRLGTFWRIANLPSIPQGMIKQVSTDAAYYALMTGTTDPTSWTAGLTTFRSMTESCAEWVWRKDMIILVRELGRAIGDLTDPTWLFHKPVWYKALWGERDKLVTLRRFLHLVLVLGQSQRFDEQFFDVSAHRVRIDAIDLLELAENPKTTERQINQFLDDVIDYAFDHPSHSFNDAVMWASFDSLNWVCVNYFQQTNPEQRYPGEQETVVEQRDWEHLRELGEQFDPDLTVTTGILPSVYSAAVVDRVVDPDGRAALRLFCESRGVELRLYADGKFDSWACAALHDQVRCSVTERRIASFSTDDEVCTTLLKRSVHLLFQMDYDNQARLGISHFEELLSVHITDQSETLSEEEVEILRELYEAWSGLRLNRPHRLPEPWKKALQDKSVRVNLREWLFTIIEVILSDPKFELIPHMGVDREEVFHRITCFANWLKDEHIRPEQIAQFMALLPRLTNSITLSPWFRELWDCSYPAITPDPAIFSPSVTEDLSHHGHTLH